MDEARGESAPVRVARRRYLTFLFSDLSDSTTLAGSIEPELYLEAIDHLKTCAFRVLSTHGGTLVDFRGDGFLAMFGFPEPTETDGRRATEAALELHEAVRCPPATPEGRRLPPLCLHSGIHSGLVLLIEGDLSPLRFTVVGEATSVAARLSETARRNEILVSATTLGGERHFFETVERGAIHLKGKAAPVSTYQVLGRSPVHTRFEASARRGLTPLIGRTESLNRLDEILREVAGGQMRSAAIVAPLGVGKTRLAEELLRRAASLGCAIYRGYGENRLDAEPLQPFVQILRTLGQMDEGRAGATAARSLPGPVSDFQPELVRALRATSVSAAEGAQPRAPSDTATDAICALFDALTRQGPAILFIDDWQWVDEATRRVAAALRERAPGSLLILIASRAVPAGDSMLGAAEIVELAPLDDAAALETIRTLRPDANPFHVRKIQRLSGGNPLFIEELCHDAGLDSSPAGQHRGDDMPAWLSTIIESRVAQLPRNEMELVCAAAAIGTVVPIWLLEAVGGRGAGDSELRALADRDLLFPGELPGTLRFKHGITHEVIYNAIGLAERQQMHLRIAGLIERRSSGNQEDVVEMLAYHCRAGGDAERTARYAELAGHKAMAAPALDRARTQYGAALAALDQLPSDDDVYRRWMAITQRLGLACVYDPTRSQLEIFRRAVQIASERDDFVAVARAEYWLAYITYALGDVGTAIDRCERARRVCRHALERTHHEALAAELQALDIQVLAILGQAHAAACEHEQALVELEQVIQARRRYKSGGRLSAGSAYTLACRGASLGDLGRFAEAHECFREALDTVADGDHAVKGSVLNWQAGVYLWQGRWAEALVVSLEACAIAQRIESLYVLGMAQSIAAYTRWMIGRDSSSIDLLERSTAWLEARDKQLFISVTYGWLADALIDMGRTGEGRRYAARAIGRARERDRFGEVMAWRAIARAPDARRRHAPEVYLARAMRAAIRRGSPHEIACVVLDQARLAALRGRRGDAVMLMERARSAFEAMEMPWHVARTDDLSAV